MTRAGFYRLAIVVPFAGLAIAAGLARPSAPLEPGWEWVYPTSISRGLLAYGLVAAWLWVALTRRGVPTFERLLWVAPLVYVGLGWLLMLGLALPRGRAGDLWAEHSGAILLRTGVHLAVGYGLVALLTLAGRLVRDGGGFTETS